MLLRGLALTAAAFGAAAAASAAGDPPNVAFTRAGPGAVIDLALVDAEGVETHRVIAVFEGGEQRELRFDYSGRPRLAATDPIALNAGRPADALPHSEPGFGLADIETAWLVDPTDRYDHAVLGDRLEAASLRVRPRDGADVTATLTNDSVFEDLAPRIVDLDLDGREEVLVVRARPDAGAALSAYGLRGGDLIRLAETPPIGQSHRWLNPIGVGDLDGDGLLEVAIIQTPHIGGIVKIWRYGEGGFTLAAERAGYSNHAIGATALGLSMVLDYDLDGRSDILAPTQMRDQIAALRLDGDAIVEDWRIGLGAALTADLLAVDFDADATPEIVVGLEDGRLGVMAFDQ